MRGRVVISFANCCNSEAEWLCHENNKEGSESSRVCRHSGMAPG